MCGACEAQERVCPAGHVQEKRHGDVFAPRTTVCVECGEPTKIRTKEA